ncbi:MAG TPA: hypothetical protein VFO24_13080, partial [Usitatibacter sp.]|nr:hypothetical protein [Usitatibacter sp.]
AFVLAEGFVAAPFFDPGFAFLALFGRTTFGVEGVFSLAPPCAGAGVGACGVVVVLVLECVDPEDEASSVASCGTPGLAGAGAGAGVLWPSSVAVCRVPAVSAPEAPLASAPMPAAVSPPPASAVRAARHTLRRGLEGAMRRIRSSLMGPI